MTLPKQRTRIIAATPIEAGGRRLLPSILVSTMEGGSPESGGLFRAVTMRPISLVEEWEEEARWHEIPNESSDILNMMRAVGLGVAGVSVVLIVLIRLFKARGLPDFTE